MTFQEIQQAVYRKVGFLDSPEAAVQTRVKQTINIWHRRVLARNGMERLRDDLITFTTVANQTTYAMPQALARINGIHETTTPLHLQGQSLEWIRLQDPQRVAIGPPQYWAEMSWRNTSADPASTGLWAVSSNAGDTTQTIYVDGSRADGTRTGAVSVQLNGTTRAQIGTYTNWTEVDNCFLSATCAGTVTVYDASSSGNVLATISIGKTRAKQLWIELWPTPASAITEYVDYTRQIEDMVQNTDEPFLPEDFQSILVDYTCYEEWLRKNDTRAKDAFAQAENQVKKLQHWVLNPPGYHPIVGKTRRPFSRLGGFFPPDSYRY